MVKRKYMWILNVSKVTSWKPRRRVYLPGRGDVTLLNRHYMMSFKIGNWSKDPRRTGPPRIIMRHVLLISVSIKSRSFVRLNPNKRLIEWKGLSQLIPNFLFVHKTSAVVGCVYMSTLCVGNLVRKQMIL